MPSDLALRAAVIAALRTALGPAAAAVTTTVHNGIVSISGVVEMPEQRVAARRALDRLPGVRALADGLSVRADGRPHSQTADTSAA